jgi:hypothetical protein
VPESPSDRRSQRDRRYTSQEFVLAKYKGVPMVIQHGGDGIPPFVVMLRVGLWLIGRLALWVFANIVAVICISISLVWRLLTAPWKRKSDS